MAMVAYAIPTACTLHVYVDKCNYLLNPRDLGLGGRLEKRLAEKQEAVVGGDRGERLADFEELPQEGRDSIVKVGGGRGLEDGLFEHVERLAALGPALVDVGQAEVGDAAPPQRHQGVHPDWEIGDRGAC